MKHFHAIMTIILSVAAATILFTANASLDLWMGLVAMLTAIIFMTFTIIEEQRDEIKRLRNKPWNNKKDGVWVVR